MDRPLVKDGDLYPANIRWCSAYRPAKDDGYSLHASTEAEKTALLIHHILSLKHYSGYPKTEIQAAVDYVVSRVTYVYGMFRTVNMDKMVDSGFNCEDAENETYLQAIFEKPAGYERETALDFFIRNTVMDDDKIIVDSDNSY